MRCSAEIKVWTFETISSPEASYRRWLDDAEQERAPKFARASDRTAFVVTRANLRRLLANEIGISPSDLRFRYTALGKPLLSTPCQGLGVDFSVSHTAGFSAIALARNCALGVDVECLHAVPDLIGIASQVFHASVAARLRALPPPDRDATFLRCWTAGEALGKATGHGIAGLGGRFPIVLDGSYEPVIAPDWQPDLRVQWRLERLDVGPGYIATLACESDGELPFVRRMPNDVLCHATGMR